MRKKERYKRNEKERERWKGNEKERGREKEKERGRKRERERGHFQAQYYNPSRHNLLYGTISQSV